MHIFPLREERRIDCSYAAQLYNAIDNKVYITEKYSHITHRSQPKLYCGVTYECGPHTKPSSDKACGYQQGHIRCVGADEIRCDQHSSAYKQAYSVGKPELQPEHDGKVYRHSDKRGIACHQNILLHQGCRANHISGGGEIYASGKLYDQYKEYKQPRFQSARHIIRDIRNIKWTLRSVPFSHISISPRIPHSFRPGEG